MSGDIMDFEDDWREFLRVYSFTDSEEIYTNGSDLISVFRVEQMVEHYFERTCHDTNPKAPYFKCDACGQGRMADKNELLSQLWEEGGGMSDMIIPMQKRVPYLLVRSFSMLVKEYEERASEQEKEDGSDFGEALDMLELAITKICAKGLEVEE